MTIRAAGGVVWRPRGDAQTEIEVLLVHRPKYDDWSLPKGKCEEGEDDLACALREVIEETGLQVQLGEELPSTDYQDRFERDKRVRYWAMRAVDGDFIPNSEVDEARWLTPDEAASLLSYARDLVVVAATAEQQRAKAHDEAADR